MTTRRKKLSKSEKSKKIRAGIRRRNALIASGVTVAALAAAGGAARYHQRKGRVAAHNDSANSYMNRVHPNATSAERERIVKELGI